MLYKHPAVLFAAVVAKPDKKWGEVPCAFVELKDGAKADEAEILAFCRKQLPGFKSPKAVVFGPLPKTSTGKIQKFELRKQVEFGRGDRAIMLDRTPRRRFAPVEQAIARRPHSRCGSRHRDCIRRSRGHVRRAGADRADAGADAARDRLRPRLADQGHLHHDDDPAADRAGPHAPRPAARRADPRSQAV